MSDDRYTVGITTADDTETHRELTALEAWRWLDMACTKKLACVVMDPKKKVVATSAGDLDPEFQKQAKAEALAAQDLTGSRRVTEALAREQASE